ncbi:uncharacterized protein LOC114157919 [Xiphophorus couchianus]|uniref:uncharacterized protein LOC114157919 n=1 Tax=Xiphophorus couchianus TaxID=32473 RepID=UPI001016FB29|nr:uncharacterized protein LOC114157919 [Xiphophorus couchianus]
MLSACSHGNTMTPLSGLFFSFILLVASPVANSFKAIVGDQLKVNGNCEPDESVRLQRVTLDGPRDVATDQGGQWQVSREEDRGRIKRDSSYIVFSPTLYTDEGTYEVTCSKSGTKTIQVKVFSASKVSVTRGDTVTLPCYGRTKEGTGLTGRWEKNGEPLCVKNSISEGCSGTPADRLTVSADWITNGDLSLTIEGAQPEDGGDYFCYIQDGKQSKSENPAAYRLTVTEKMTHQMINNSTAAPRNQTQSCAELTQPWQISTGVLTAILLLVALFYLCRCGKNRCDSGKLYELVHRSCHASNSGEDTTGV